MPLVYKLMSVTNVADSVEVGLFSSAEKAMDHAESMETFIDITEVITQFIIQPIWLDNGPTDEERMTFLLCGDEPILVKEYGAVVKNSSKKGDLIIWSKDNRYRGTV